MRKIDNIFKVIVTTMSVWCYCENAFGSEPVYLEDNYKIVTNKKDGSLKVQYFNGKQWEKVGARRIEGLTSKYEDVLLQLKADIKCLETGCHPSDAVVPEYLNTYYAASDPNYLLLLYQQVIESETRKEELQRQQLGQQPGQSS